MAIPLFCCWPELPVLRADDMGSNAQFEVASACAVPSSSPCLRPRIDDLALVKTYLGVPQSLNGR
eukprot:6174651-Pleurochrysis_carterae.AAC.7